MPLTCCFRAPSHSKRVHGSQTLLELALQHFLLNFSFIQYKSRQKTSSLVRSEVLGLFGNTLTADHMYSSHRWGKLLQQLQTLLSQKRRQFPGIFMTFAGSTENFAHFEKKDLLHSLIILKVIDSEKCGYFMARKLLFQNTLLQQTCSRALNTAGTSTETLSSQFSINIRQIDLGNISLSHIRKICTVL